VSTVTMPALFDGGTSMVADGSERAASSDQTLTVAAVGQFADDAGGLGRPSATSSRRAIVVAIRW
jgi:hypothetical protein